MKAWYYVLCWIILYSGLRADFSFNSLDKRRNEYAGLDVLFSQSAKS